MSENAQPQQPVGGNYDPYVALEFFKSAGEPVDIKQGKTIFAQAEKEIPVLRRSKMYLLLKGEVGLFAGKKLLGTVKPGEIFGEMAVLSHGPRSASAETRMPCTLISLDDKEFKQALKKKPSFAVMLMGVMIRRLREAVSSLKASGGLSKDQEAKEAVVFDADQIKDMVEGMSRDEPVLYRAGASIIAEGSKGVRMYVVIEGRVNVQIGGRMVERVGPGGVFGEAALVDGATRLATATAETDCELLPVSRTAFIELVKFSPEFAQAMLASLSERLRFLTARIG
jgi:CRP/FNR family cyclic AMP-dependent transcriptional regulator